MVETLKDTIIRIIVSQGRHLEEASVEVLLPPSLKKEFDVTVYITDHRLNVFFLENEQTLK